MNVCDEGIYVLNCIYALIRKCEINKYALVYEKKPLHSLTRHDSLIGLATSAACLT